LITGRTHESFLGVVIQYSENPEDVRTLRLVSETGSSQKSNSSETSVKVGLLGAGGFASSTLIPAMKASAATSLISVCAATGSHAQHAGRKFGFHDCTTDEAALIHDPEVNTVVVATRHHLHAMQVLAAVGAGKNVFCEKPLCLTGEELRDIVRAYLRISSANRPSLMVGFNRRFAPMIVKMKSFLNSITEPLALNYRVNAGCLPSDHWVNDREQGGGRIIGEVCHFVDLLMFLAGSPITEVAARAVGSSARYSGDNVLVSLRFANGSEGTISYLANGDRSFSKERLEIFGGGATAVLEDFRYLELVRNGRKRTVRSRWRQDKGHVAEWAAFVRSLQPKAAPAIGFDELICSTLATLRIEESVATGMAAAVDVASFLDGVRKFPDQSLNHDE
jgi:predicted dehydrogenase